jgi:hypothetical protein
MRVAAALVVVLAGCHYAPIREHCDRAEVLLVCAFAKCEVKKTTPEEPTDAPKACKNDGQKKAR